MRIAAVVVVCLLASAARVRAEDVKPAEPAAKPSKADAAKVVDQWYEAVDGTDDLGPAIALTASSFMYSAYDENGDGPGCKISTATTAAKIKKAVKCMAKYRADRPSDVGDWQVWSSKVSKKSMGGIKTFKSRLDKLAKTSTVLSYHMECAGNENQIVVGVTNEGGTPKVSAILYESVFCGE